MSFRYLLSMLSKWELTLCVCARARARMYAMTNKYLTFAGLQKCMILRRSVV